LKAEGEKQSVILGAEGRLEAANRDAEARERLAGAEATATAMVSKAIAEGNVQALNYFVAQKYVETLGHIAGSPNVRLALLPMEMAGIAGSIAGISELIKTAMAKPD
jgi:regulator of protease activity HflC (stomatin/prohibitin superfamily)